MTNWFYSWKIIKIPQIGVKIVFKSLKCILTTFQQFQNTVGKGLLIIKASTCNWGQIHRGFSLTVLLIYLNFYDCNQVWILLRDAFHSKKPNKQTSFVQIKRIWGNMKNITINLDGICIHFVAAVKELEQETQSSGFSCR